MKAIKVERGKFFSEEPIKKLNLIFILTITFQLIGMILPVNLFITTVFFVFGLTFLIIMKEFLIRRKRRRALIYSLLLFLFYIYDILSIFYRKLDTPNYIHFATLGAGITLLIISVISDRDIREEIIRVFNATKIVEPNDKIEKKDGDVELCVNRETEEPVIIPYEDRFLHMLVLGPTGCGKTSQVLNPLINQDMQNKSFGITVIEPKGDLAEKVYAMGKYYNRESIYFNPTHPDCPYFNPFFGDEADVIENMATTFKMLSASEKSNPFFDNMNENLIRNSLKVLKRLKGNEATLIDLSTLIYNSQGMGKKMVSEFSRLESPTAEITKENGDIASWFLGEYFNEKSKIYEHCSGLRSQVSKLTSNKHLRRVLNPPDGRNDVDFGEVIEKGKILAISTAQGELRELGRYLGYFIILNLQSSVFKRPGTEFTRKPHSLYIDEFQSYSNPGFADMLTQGRSYRVASHLATQNRALMAMGAGKDGDNFVKLVSTNARNVVIFPGGNSEDAKYYSSEFGEITKIEERKSISKQKFNPIYGFKKVNYPNESISENEVTEARFSHSDIIYKEFGEVIYRIVSNKTVQRPDVGIVSWIPKKLNKKLDAMIMEYNEEKERKHKQLKHLEVEICEDLSIVSEVEDIIFDGDEIPAVEKTEKVEKKIVVIEDVIKTEKDKKESKFDFENEEVDDLI